MFINLKIIKLFFVFSCIILISKLNAEEEEIYLKSISDQIQVITKDLKTLEKAVYQKSDIVSNKPSSAIKSDGLDGDAALGCELLKNSLQGPARQIVTNAGLEAAVVVNNVLGNKSKSHGFDAREEKYCDMIKAGIIDPTLVTRTAVQNAASIAGLLLTTEAVRPKTRLF